MDADRVDQVSGSAARRLAARRVAALVVGSCVLFASVAAVAAGPDDQSTATLTAAKWAPRKVHFNYTPVSPSSTTTYLSCDRLQGQITAILQQLGARDAVVTPFGCITVGGPERFAGVDATFSVLEPAGSDDKSAASSEHVQAQWDRVNVGRDTSCELMKQVDRSILPLFTTRNTNTGCPPRFSVEVLRPVKAPATSS
jgi:hypothetical protein